jgi:hypothetical protein
MKKMIGMAVGGLLLFLLTFGGAYFLAHKSAEGDAGKVKEITTTVLAQMKGESRISAYAGSFVTVVNAQPHAGQVHTQVKATDSENAKTPAAPEEHHGSTPATTPTTAPSITPTAPTPGANSRILLVSGHVRYDIDITSLKPDNVIWDDESKILTIVLPAFILSGPDINMHGVRELRPDGALAPVHNAGEVLGDNGIKDAKLELLKQAWGDEAMQRARDATRHLIERTFSVPLHAAGVKATVKAKFANEMDAEGKE